jgi:DMSO/TMAO reductase YedYZ molybdopterin-dependent catalytic subunit
MSRKSERGLFELYANDPERADAIAFGRRSSVGRRGFLQGAGLTAMSVAVGGMIPFVDRLPAGFIPAAFAQGAASGPKPLKMAGKAEIMVIQERPLNAETPEHMLDDDVTPNAKYFIRNNGLPPDPPSDPRAWKVTIDGEVNNKLDLTVGELERRFPMVSLKLQLECGGNGRSFFSPETRGNQWGNGAAGCAEWTGVRLRDVLQAAGLKPSAVYTGQYGGDTHLSGNPNQPSISRGMRIAKAMDEHTLIAVRMNGEQIPNIHGGPVRLVVPGWAGSLSQKWLTRIWIRDKEHDGSGMGGFSYRTMRTPIVPGGKADEKNTVILESMPVRSIISSPANGSELPAGTRQLSLRGAAWAGDKAVRSVDISLDFGASWQPTRLGTPANKFAWQRWTATAMLPAAGYYEIWARATDSDGRMQPHIAGGWNPQGYGGNPFHRVAVLVPA